MSQQINLYSPLFRKQKKLLSAMVLVQATGLLVLAVAGFYFYLSVQTSRLEARVADSSRQLQNELEQLKVSGAQPSPDARVKLLAERRKKLEAEFNERTQALQAMDKGVAGRTEGYSGLLRALARLSMDGIWLTRVRFSTLTSSSISRPAGALRSALTRVTQTSIMLNRHVDLSAPTFYVPAAGNLR